jgi:hypothetical protein
MKKFIILCFFFLALSPFVHAQMERTVYQSFEIDSMETLIFDLVGDYELIVWAGNSVLTETNVQISHASPSILDYLIENGRYEILPKLEPTTASFTTKNKDRKPIKNASKTECIEVITLKVFVPDTFEWSKDDLKHLRKKTKPSSAGK